MSSGNNSLSKGMAAFVLMLGTLGLSMILLGIIGLLATVYVP